MRSRALFSLSIWLKPICVTLFFWSMNIGAKELYIGAAHRLITLDPLISVSEGEGAPKPVNEKKGELFVGAIVLQKTCLGKMIGVQFVSEAKDLTESSPIP